MADSHWRKRIVVSRRTCHGTPCVRGTRVTVGMIVNSLAQGQTLGELLRRYPGLTKEDVEAALQFAAEME